MGLNQKHGKNVPIDRGWAWAVMIGSFGVHFMTIGYTRSFGILFVAFQSKFGSSSASTAVISGVQCVTYSLTTLVVVNILMHRLNIRTICLIGSLLQVISLCTSSVVTDVNQLICSQGIIFGAGQACIHCPSMVILSEHFEKYRSIATVIATCGVSTGGIAFPLVIRYLLNEYNLSGTLVLIGGLLLQQVIFSSLFTPFSKYSNIMEFETQGELEPMNKFCQDGERNKSTENGKDRNQVECSLPINSDACGEKNVLQTEDEKSFLSEREKESENEFPSKDWYEVKDISKHINLNDCSDDPATLLSYSSPTLGNKTVSPHVTQRPWIFRKSLSTQGHETLLDDSQGVIKTSTKSLFYPKSKSMSVNPIISGTGFDSKSSRHLLPVPGVLDTLCAVSTTDIYNSVHSLKQMNPGSEEKGAEPERECEQMEKKRFCCKCPSPPAVIRQPPFWLVAIFFCGAGVASSLPTTFLPPFAKERGSDLDESALVLLISAFTEIAGRLVLGLILHFTKSRPSVILILPLALCGTMYHLSVFVQGVPALFTFSAFCGFFIGTFWALQSLVVIEVLGMRRLGPALGFYSIITGASNGFSFPLAGALRDTSGTYTSTFHYFGTLYYIAVLALIVLQYFIVKKDKEKAKTWENCQDKQSKLCNDSDDAKKLGKDEEENYVKQV